MSEDKKSDDGKKSESGSGPMEMGMGMAKKMMGQMSGGDSGPMKKGMGMAKKMMAPERAENESGDSGSNPMMQMCKQMLGTIKQTMDMSAFATPELQAFFSEWLEVLEKEAIEQISANESMTAKGLAESLNVSEESAAFLIARLIKAGKIKAELSVQDTPA